MSYLQSIMGENALRRHRQSGRQLPEPLQSLYFGGVTDWVDFPGRVVHDG
jgi:hypothetical protein